MRHMGTCKNEGTDGRENRVSQPVARSLIFAHWSAPSDRHPHQNEDAMVVDARVLAVTSMMSILPRDRGSCSWPSHLRSLIISM